MTITQEVNIEMLEKLPDGNLKIKYPKTKSNIVIMSDGKTLEEAIAYSLDDNTDSPGAKKLITGTKALGYFGFVSSSEFINGVTLASQIGLSLGTSINSDEGWIKCIKNEKIMFVAKKPLRSSISWNDINAIGAVMGTKVITINGLQYKVRLLTGGNGNPSSSAGGEWNEIMYGIHESQNPSWAFYTNNDLDLSASSWCQETDSSNASNRARRGNSNITQYSTGAATLNNFTHVWRPVLELI